MLNLGLDKILDSQINHGMMAENQIIGVTCRIRPQFPLHR
jgi:hypothetical protein